MIRKILYGVSGIGRGHINRELPIIKHFADKGCRLVIFCYDQSLTVATQAFAQYKNVTLQKINIPFWNGGSNGLDFALAAHDPHNQHQSFFIDNAKAMAVAKKILGRPDLVISDYEPLSAQYAYACGAPLVTIDQQSKFLSGLFPKTLGGYRFLDEVERLNMFFPKTAAQLVCSFFTVPKRLRKDVKIFPPIIKQEILSLIRDHRPSRSILVYISAARDFVQSDAQIISVLNSFPEFTFHLFTAQKTSNTSKNVITYRHGDERFYQVLRQCRGIISTAGHTLISEAMHLRLPVYALPVSPYEQHLNAHIVAKHGFGVSAVRLERKKLNGFLKKLPAFQRRITEDKRILLKGIGQNKIIDFLEKRFGN